MNIRDGHASLQAGTPQAAKHSAVVLDSCEVQAMRHRLHELANVFTGVVIAAGLLSQYLEGGSLRQYAADICEGSERGCSLVRELRSQLLAACGEVEAVKDPSANEAAPHDPKI
jgi:nitrogen-specific signal transduction histidine kinase